VSKLAATSLTTALVCMSCCLVGQVQAFVPNGKPTTSIILISGNGKSPSVTIQTV